MNVQEDHAIIASIIAGARAAQKKFEIGANQTRFDQAALAAGWAIMEPQRNRTLAEVAVKTTGLGTVADKMIKNHGNNAVVSGY